MIIAGPVENDSTKARNERMKMNRAPHRLEGSRERLLVLFMKNRNERNPHG
jgi:hypothetical protein